MEGRIRMDELICSFIELQKNLIMYSLLVIMQEQNQETEKQEG